MSLEYNGEKIADVKQASISYEPICDERGEPLYTKVTIIAECIEPNGPHRPTS